MTRKDFIEVVKNLNTDLRKNPDKWENNSLNDYLEAISRYTEEIQAFYDNTNQNINSEIPSWKIFADILKGASIYE
ncbi:hypothetical protein SAMN04489761_3608 [Tenacibaculum sp. MAR_2009_124]|uniref:DUF7660 family protein n=1 Tax=Tenacibaculum sp. MAR_2009_124 TaxID=1250059 RepID=UPI0008995042|nr:hypothetical protein [Tenacibaculum sp. MAR_2009_124]SEC79590.1 hypothetical protein SAMN04489761_3608 [Tenacibaculum sp. MAR_2009_124]